MIAKFDGTDEAFQAQERDDLRQRHGMSWGAIPMAFHIDGEWQVWWRDVKQGTWFYRPSPRKAVQIPMTVVP